MRPAAAALVICALLAGCGGRGRRASAPARAVPAPSPTLRPRSHRRPDPLAFLTAETENRLVVVDLRTARPIAGEAVPAGPRYVAVTPTRALVTSFEAGTVTVLARDPLRVLRVLRGFGTPQLAAVAPGGRDAYVTNDARGTLTEIDLAAPRVLRTIAVGAGAHHFAISPDGREAWIALGEAAGTIVAVNLTGAPRPRPFDPGFAVHDLLFSPDGRQVWLTAAAGPDVVVLDAATRRALFAVPVGPPPQHVAFAGPVAYLTSGYGSTIERVDAATGRVLDRARTPYGSFELDADGSAVVTASLLDGELAIFTPGLSFERAVAVAPATRDVALAAGSAH